jgi:hypothetical protein
MLLSSANTVLAMKINKTSNNKNFVSILVIFHSDENTRHARFSVTAGVTR